MMMMTTVAVGVSYANTLQVFNFTGPSCRDRHFTLMVSLLRRHVASRDLL